MMSSRGQRKTNDQQLWSMGAVSRRTGLSTHTLRAWERRFGFPDPVRLASGHRRYPADQVRRLGAIQAALERGHRISDLIHLDESEIEALLGEGVARESGFTESISGDYLDACRRLDSDALTLMMRHDAASLGISRFLSKKVIPFVEDVGRGWEQGTLSIRHEHASTEVVETVLRELRSPLARGLSGRPVVLATLPGELHGLGLQIVALHLVERGVPVRILGTDTPADEIAEAAAALSAAAVALSISEASSSRSFENVETLRNALPSDVRLVVGGRGAGRLDPPPSGVKTASSFDELDRVILGGS